MIYLKIYQMMSTYRKLAVGMVVLLPLALFSFSVVQPEIWIKSSAAAGIEPAKQNPPTIIGGEVAEPSAWPWQVALEFRGSGGLICGGALLSEEWVITAAHCIITVNFNQDAIQVRLGVHNRAIDRGVIIHAAELIVHENTFSNQPPDLGLVRLSQAVALNDVIQPVSYGATTMPELYAPGMVGTVTGWGSTSADALVLPEELRQLSLPIQDNATCILEIGDQHNGISDFDICAGQLIATESGCTGDSGGPFVTQTDAGDYIMVGVVSRASNLSRNCQSYNIFTHIPRSAAWIEAQSGVAPYGAPDAASEPFVVTDTMFLPVVLQ